MRTIIYANLSGLCISLSSSLTCLSFSKCYLLFLFLRLSCLSSLSVSSPCRLVARKCQLQSRFVYDFENLDSDQKSGKFRLPVMICLYDFFIEIMFMNFHRDGSCCFCSNGYHSKRDQRRRNFH